MGRNKCLLFIFLLFCSFIYAQTGHNFLISADPTVYIPLGGPSLEDGTGFYAIGGGISVKGEYILPFLPLVYTGIALDADFIPTHGYQDAITFISPGVGAGVRFSPLSRLTVKAGGYGGIYFGHIDNNRASNPFVTGTLDVSLKLNPALSLGAGASYKHFFVPEQVTLYQGLGLSLGFDYHIGSSQRQRNNLKMAPEISPVFPLFYSHYDKHPLGELKITNTSVEHAENVRISFFVRQYMDQPKVSGEIKKLYSGQQIKLPLYALFTEKIFSLTEGTKVAGEISIEYGMEGRTRTETVPVTVTVNNRNAVTWDDSRKVAAFVTAKDPLILGFAKRIAVSVNEDGKTAISPAFRTGMALFEALTAYGLGYVIDPVTPYNKTSGQKEAIDYIQFPGQTMAYRAGDCDDLSVLYAALLEAVGIPAAFITIPGHIYLAFDLGLSPETAAKIFHDAGDLIIRNDTAWLPMEVTLVKNGFLEAWQTGAKEWRENNPRGLAGFYPVREAWELYEPVAFSDYKEALVLPDTKIILPRYQETLNKIIESEVKAREQSIKNEYGKSGRSAKLHNNLGIMYARFGLLEKAAAEFDKSLGVQENAAALINLGNVSYLKNNNPQAIKYYRRALKIVPDNITALNALIRTSYELEDYKTVEPELARLAQLAPDQYAALAGDRKGQADTNRAAAIGTKEVKTWSEE